VFVERRISNQPAADLHARYDDFVAVPNGHLHLELLRLVVHQQDPEGAVVDDAAREVCDTRQQLVELQDCTELARDVGQCLKRRRVLARALEQPRVLDRDGHVRAELSRDHLVGFGEVSRRVAEEIEGADDAPLAAQGHHELRAGAGNRLDIARIRLQVVDHQRPACSDRRADQALPDSQAQRALGTVRIADRVGHRELVALRIEQVYGKGLKSRQPREQLRNLLQQLVEVEHRRHFSTQLEERNDDLANVHRHRGRRRGGGGIAHGSFASDARQL
jgi:hypothetical protein